MAPEICSRTDRQTDRQTHRHTDVLITILRRRCRGRSSKCIISEGLMHVAAWYRMNPGLKFTKFTKFGECVSIGQTPNAFKFLPAPTRRVRDIRCRNFFLPRKVDQISPTSLKVCYAPMPLVVPNFIGKRGEGRKQLCPSSQNRLKYASTDPGSRPCR